MHMFSNFFWFLFFTEVWIQNYIKRASDLESFGLRDNDFLHAFILK